MISAGGFKDEWMCLYDVLDPVCELEGDSKVASNFNFWECPNTDSYVAIAGKNFMPNFALERSHKFKWLILSHKFLSRWTEIKELRTAFCNWSTLLCFKTEYGALFDISWMPHPSLYVKTDPLWKTVTCLWVVIKITVFVFIAFKQWRQNLMQWRTKYRIDEVLYNTQTFKI